MEKQIKSFQDTDALVKRRKWKNRLSISAIVVAVAAISAVSIGNYMRTRQAASTDDTDAFGQRGERDGFSDTVMASGTTSVGVDAVTFEIDFLEDADLYVEEVYLSNGDTVAAGDKYIKFTDESIADARTELEATALSASLSYRSGVISNGESKLQAKYTYDAAMLEANYAQQVYDDTVAALEAQYAQAVKYYEEAEEEYNTYYEKVQNNSFYEEYDVASLKKAYEEAYDLYVDRKAYWDVTEDELKNSSSDNKEMSALPTLSGSVKSDTSVINVIDTESSNEGTANETAEDETPDEGNTGEESAPEEGSGENSGEGSEGPEDGKRPDKDGMPGNFGARGNNQEEQAAQNDRKWIVKTITLLEEEMEQAKEDYEKALDSYEKEIDSAELNLQKLFNQLETAREDYTDADITYQKELLSAKTAYETAAAKGKMAQTDYDTQLTSLADSLDRLQDAKEEAEDNLALFEELVGDGYLYTEEAGTVLMVTAAEGQPLAGGSMVLAYSNPKELSVSVSVSQDDIAKLYVGETATVMISDYGNFNGVIETINPVSSSDSRTSVAYTVIVHLEGDISELSSNLTASVVFGEQTREHGASDAIDSQFTENETSDTEVIATEEVEKDIPSTEVFGHKKSDREVSDTKTFDTELNNNGTFGAKGGRDGQSGKNGKEASDQAD